MPASFEGGDSGSAKADSSPALLGTSPDLRIPDDSDSFALEKVRLLIACVLAIVHVSVVDGWGLNVRTSDAPPVAVSADPSS